MTAATKKALIIFGISTTVVAAILCCVPIELFDGEVVWKINDQEVVSKQSLSLSYFFGIGLGDTDLSSVRDFRLTAQGWMLVFIFIIGLPGLLSYRFYLKATAPEEEK